jgi:hypothetical protein
VSTAKLATKAVGSAQLADGAVGTAQIADGAVDIAQLADGAATSSKVKLQSGQVRANQGTEPVVTLEPIPAGTLDYTEIPGTRTTFTVDVPSTVLINAIFDIATSGTDQSRAAAVGMIMVDGKSAGIAQSILDIHTFSRASIGSTSIVSVDAGTHTIQLGAYANNNTAYVYSHTHYTYLVFAR